jgi:hypothetical protein
LEVSLTNPGNYKHAEQWKDSYMGDRRTLEQLYREETDEYEL